MGEKGPEACWRQACLPLSFITPLPARPSADTEGRRRAGQGRADTLGGWVGKRSGPAERLLQLLAGRWVPGAGELGVQRRARTEERKSSSSTCKRNTKRRQTHERKPARCEQAPALSRGRSLAALSGPTWLLPVGGGTLQSRPPPGPHESTASHAPKSWGVVGGRGKPGDPVSAVCQPGTGCLSGVPAPGQGLGGLEEPGLQPAPQLGMRPTQASRQDKGRAGGDRARSGPRKAAA